MTIYRVSKLERYAMIHYNTAKTLKAVEEAMYDLDGECPEKVADFKTKAEAEAFARSIDTTPFTRFSPAHVCWEVAIVSTINVDEDGDEEEEDYYELSVSVDEVMAFVAALEENSEEEEEDL